MESTGCSAKRSVYGRDVKAGCSGRIITKRNDEESAKRWVFSSEKAVASAKASGVAAW